MSLPISPASVPLDKLADQLVRAGVARRSRIAVYLDSIADDASLLARIWRETWEKRREEFLAIDDDVSERVARLFPQDRQFADWLSDKCQRNSETPTSLVKLAEDLRGRVEDYPGNWTPHTRLATFYEHLSSVVEVDADAEQVRLTDQFLNSLAHLLLKRQVAVDQLEKFAQAIAVRRELVRRSTHVDQKRQSRFRIS